MYVASGLSGYPEDGGAKFLLNTTKYLPAYTVSHPSNLYSHRRESVKSHKICKKNRRGGGTEQACICGMREQTFISLEQSVCECRWACTYLTDF
jgi:hypothetical protein